MRPFVWLLAVGVAAGTLLAPAGGAGAQLLITGNDEKISFDETGKTVTHPPGIKKQPFLAARARSRNSPSARKTGSFVPGPMVRIHLPPAESRVRN